MSNKLHADGVGGQGIPLREFARSIGVSETCMQRWCRAGKVFGARLHPLTRKWWIYPPAKLLCVPRNLRADSSIRMSSTSRANEQG